MWKFWEFLESSMQTKRAMYPNHHLDINFVLITIQVIQSSLMLFTSS